ncbi:MAG: protease modulator HflC [Gammaproteobacteria bacterium]
MDRKTTILAALVALLVLALLSVYTIRETERALLMEFGEIVDPDLKPGIHVMAPWQKVVRFDARVQVMDTRPTEYLTKESKILVVDAYVVYRIADNQQFFTATSGGDLNRAQMLLGERAINGLKNKVSQRTLLDVVSGARDEMMAELTAEVGKQARPEFGVEILDIRVKKVDYPESAVGAVFERMRTERQREAREHRAEGKEEAEKIRAEAEKERTVLLADAFRQAQRIRGEGDAKAAAVSAAAYNKDADFYQFWRSMEAYRETFSGPENVMVIQPDNAFFKQMHGR